MMGQVFCSSTNIVTGRGDGSDFRVATYLLREAVPTEMANGRCLSI